MLEAGDALKLFNECPGCDLTDANLAGLTFPPGADLSNATLSGATIYNTDLSQAVLTGATFGVDSGGEPAVISDSSLQGAHLEGTVFDQTIIKATGFEQASITCASFSDTVLLEASFEDASWSSPSCPRPTFQRAVVAMNTVPPPEWANVSFDASTIVVNAATQALAKGITLSAWTFTDSQFLGLPPDLSGITVSGATLDGSSFTLANFTDATFNGPTSIQKAVFVDATMDGVKLPGAVAHGAVFTGANLEGAVFNGAQLGAGTNPDAPLATATFTNADAHGASFANIQARGVAFDGAYLYPGDSAVTFDGAELDNATFTGAVLGSTAFTNITAPSIRFDRAQCVNCDFSGAPGAHIAAAVLRLRVHPRGDLQERHHGERLVSQRRLLRHRDVDVHAGRRRVGGVRAVRNQPGRTVAGRSRVRERRPLPEWQRPDDAGRVRRGDGAPGAPAAAGVRGGGRS